jgi:hypothetical protein
VIGKHKSKVFKFEALELKGPFTSDNLGQSETALIGSSGMRPISILQSLLQSSGTTGENAPNSVIQSSLEGLLDLPASDDYYDESYSYDPHENENEKSDSLV